MIIIKYLLAFAFGLAAIIALIFFLVKFSVWVKNKKDQRIRDPLTGQFAAAFLSALSITFILLDISIEGTGLFGNILLLVLSLIAFIRLSYMRLKKK